MNANLQLIPVGLLLVWSSWRLLRHLFPVWSRDVQNRLAQRVTRSGWARLGRWLQSGESGAGCGDGCDTCGNCATPVTTASSDPAAEQGVKLVGKMGEDQRQ